MKDPQAPVPYMPPLRVFEAIGSVHPAHAGILANAIVSTQADNVAYWLDELASILRYAYRVTGHSCSEYLQGSYFLDYSEDHQGVLRFNPAAWRHGAREFLGE